MFGNDEPKNEWRGGVYLTTVKKSFDADLLESKLKSEGIPCLKKYVGASNAMEIIMGTNIGFSIDLYVPEEALEDAKNIIIAFPLLSDESEELEAISEEELERQALAAGIDGEFYDEVQASEEGCGEDGESADPSDPSDPSDLSDPS